DLGGDADAPRVRQVLQARRDIDAVAIEIAALDHHIAEIDADAQQNSPLPRQTVVRGRHALLQLHRADNCVDGAGKFYEHPIAHHLDDTTAMRRHQGIEDARSEENTSEL